MPGGTAKIVQLATYRSAAAISPNAATTTLRDRRFDNPNRPRTLTPAQVAHRRRMLACLMTARNTDSQDGILHFLGCEALDSRSDERP
jgi:hypothetical protein